MKYIVDESRLVDIANAIRGKTGGTEAITLDRMPTEIAGIKSGGGLVLFEAEVNTVKSSVTQEETE